MTLDYYVVVGEAVYDCSDELCVEGIFNQILQKWGASVIVRSVAIVAAGGTTGSSFYSSYYAGSSGGVASAIGVIGNASPVASGPAPLSFSSWCSHWCPGLRKVFVSVSGAPVSTPLSLVPATGLVTSNDDLSLDCDCIFAQIFDFDEYEGYYDR